jgi:hypothetical protein
LNPTIARTITPPMTPAVEIALSIPGQEGAVFSVFGPVYAGRKFQSGRKAVVPP